MQVIRALKKQINFLGKNNNKAHTDIFKSASTEKCRSCIIQSIKLCHS